MVNDVSMGSNRDVAAALLEREVERFTDVPPDDVRAILGPGRREQRTEVVDGEEFYIDVQLETYRRGGMDLLFAVSNGSDLAFRPLTELLPVAAADPPRFTPLTSLGRSLRSRRERWMPR